MPRTSWPALRLHLPSADRERLGYLLWAALDDLRPTAIEDRTERDGTLVVFFPLDGQRSDAAARLRQELGRLGLVVAEIDVKDEGWAERSQASITAVRVGRLTIAPPWDCPVPSPETIVIVPSMGFGTGHHQSTRPCLEALQRLDLLDQTVIDAGTGSGVLAIAAVRLGARAAIGLDTDEDALSCARENAALNGVGDRVSWERSDVRGFAARPGDVVMANLTGPLLIASARDLVRLARPGGFLILSGLLGSEEIEVVSAFQDVARFDSRAAEGEWVGLLLTRTP